MTVQSPRRTYLVAFGSNLGTSGYSPEATLRHAFQALAKHGLTLSAVSRFFATPCFPAGSGPDYVNACAAIRGPSEPEGMLGILHRIEAEFGRLRERRWGARGLDLDLIALGQSVHPEANLVQSWIDLPLEAQMRDAPQTLLLPHPRIQDRAFVLVPLCDIAPGWRHPILGLTARQMLEALPAEVQAEPRALTQLDDPAPSPS